MDERDEYELEVTMRFNVPVTSSQPLDPIEMATHMRERWINNDEELVAALDEAASGEFDLEVKPTFYSS